MNLISKELKKIRGIAPHCSKYILIQADCLLIRNAFEVIFNLISLIHFNIIKYGDYVIFRNSIHRNYKDPTKNVCRHYKYIMMDV